MRNKTHFSVLTKDMNFLACGKDLTSYTRQATNWQDVNCWGCKKVRQEITKRIMDGKFREEPVMIAP